jgi:hypothetical protein
VVHQYSASDTNALQTNALRTAHAASMLPQEL